MMQKFRLVGLLTCLKTIGLLSFDSFFFSFFFFGSFLSWELRLLYQREAEKMLMKLSHEKLQLYKHIDF